MVLVPRGAGRAVVGVVGVGTVATGGETAVGIVVPGTIPYEETQLTLVLVCLLPANPGCVLSFRGIPFIKNMTPRFSILDVSILIVKA